ncbi:MAG TPA: hypothetical protein VK052_05410 [Zeimonas sp.]|nr:hypothetical protein [Zeimonas sp.]
MKSPNVDRDVVRATAASLFAIAALASCGGDSAGPVVVVPTPPACESTVGGGSGFAVGSCGVTATNVFQPVLETVAVYGVDSYVLALDFPPNLPQALDEPGVGFLVASRSLDDARNVVGALRGKSYDNPASAVMQPPYASLTDFHRSWVYPVPPTDPPALDLARASFGTWEKFALPTDPTQGYVGAWYGKRADPLVPEWPTGAVRSYSGYVVGVIGPDGSAGAGLSRLQRFSAPLTLSVDGFGAIAAGQIGPLTISYLKPGDTAFTLEPLPIDPIGFVQTGGAPPGELLGSLQSAGGAGADVLAGAFEARYFGALADFGAEIAGRVRFTTSNGLVAVAAFGAKRQ